MIDLLEYFDTYAQGTYYERYLGNIQRVEDDEWFFGEPSILVYTVYDEIEIEEKFRLICQPSSGYSYKDESWFLLICFYYFKNKVYIRQFPELFKRPRGLTQFAYDDIRQYAFNNGYTNGDMSKVAWSIRRQIIKELIFERSIQGIQPSEQIINLIHIIESNSSAWQEISLDAKLAALNNVIEYCLKRGGEFVEIPNIVNIFDFVKCREFRNKTHCMRHGSEAALFERKILSNSEKQFLIDYGISLVHLIRRNMNNEPV